MHIIRMYQHIRIGKTNWFCHLFYKLNLCYSYEYTLMSYTLRKVLPQVCMENTARGGMLTDKYSMRQSQMLYSFRDTP